MPPRVDARGRRIVRTPLCTPLPTCTSCRHRVARLRMSCAPPRVACAIQVHETYPIKKRTSWPCLRPPLCPCRFFASYSNPDRQPILQGQVRVGTVQKLAQVHNNIQKKDGHTDCDTSN